MMENMGADDWKGEHLIKIERNYDGRGHRMPVAPEKNTNAARIKAAKERREKVLPMIEAGMTSVEIGEILGVPAYTIQKDAKVLGMSLIEARRRAKA